MQLAMVTARAQLWIQQSWYGVMNEAAENDVSQMYIFGRNELTTVTHIYMP